MIHFLAHIMGLDNLSGHWYAFWSGFGSDLGEVAVLGMIYNKLICHERGCLRIGKHHIDGTPYVVCRKHHPSID